jgi:hypothetical protein
MRLHSMWGWKRRKEIEEGRMGSGSYTLVGEGSITQTSLNSDS